MAMTEEEKQEIATAVVDLIVDVLDGPEVKTRFMALEAEVEKLKSRPLQKWAGIFVAGVPYAEASLVTKGGSLWCAVRQTDTTPGDPGSDWRLIVKKGGA